MYGEKCYNHSESHLAGFAHPWRETSESTEDTKKRKDMEFVHELLNTAKASKWDIVKASLAKQPDLVNMRPPERNFALIHFACFQICHDWVMWLVDEAGADPKLLTNDGKTPQDVLAEAMRTKPPDDLNAKMKDKNLVEWLNKRTKTGGGPASATSSPTSPADITGSAAGYGAGAALLPATGKVADGTGKPASSPRMDSEPRVGGTTMAVGRCLKSELNGDYVELKTTKMGYPVYLKLPTAIARDKYLLHYRVERGWTISKKMDDADGMAYLGPHVIGGDPSRKHYGENWKVLFGSGMASYYMDDRLMSVTARPDKGRPLPTLQAR